MLGLTVPTEDAWVLAALRDLNAVLVDHAHCEMKAATNALSLAARHPQDLVIVEALAELAAEEVAHFRQVVSFLAARGATLGHPTVDEYAALLRKRMNSAQPPEGISPLVDRLLVGALIEARSCERFALLVQALESRGDSELIAFYKELFACEARHYRVYVDLAKRASGDADLTVARLEQLASLEGEVVRTLAAQHPKATIHG